MKIQQTCDEKPKAPIQTCFDLPSNTVFKVLGNTTTWLKTSNGYLNLATSEHHLKAGFGEHCKVDLVYPNARIVLE